MYLPGFAGREIGRDAKCPVMVVTGDCDELVPPEVVGHLRAGLAENSSVSDWAIRVYEGAGHAFAHKPQSDQDQVDAEASLQSAIQWLDRYV